jgi:phosphoglycolate phosphatase
MEYQAYIFDLDGTLLDTLGDLAASTNHALRVHHMPEHTIDDVRRFVGNGVRKLMERAVPGGVANPLFEQALATFREHYTQHSLDTTQPYPGIIDLLQRLKASGKMVAVVSNKFDAATKSLCQHFFGSLVDVAIGESESVRKKPAPDTVMEALRLLEIEKEQAVYIGDSDVDIDTARNSGIPCISVTWGFRDRNFLLDHGATILVENPEEIS